MSRALSLRLIWVIPVLLISTGVIRAAEAPRFILENWKDPARDRTIPVKIYLPPDLSAERPAPVVIFSHGLGGSRNNYVYIGEYWATHGYVSVHLQHAGSDTTALINADGFQGLRKAMTAENYIDRARDVTFAIDHLTEMVNDTNSKLAKKIDLNRIAMAGHSFGAMTTLAIAGQTATVGPRELSIADPRVKCAIAMSPSPPADKGNRDHAFDKIVMPVLYMTGTRDSVPIQPMPPEDRKLPYSLNKSTDQYLIVFEDGDHMLFGGRGRHPEYIEYVQKSTTAFLDSYLKNDLKSREFLRTDFAKELGSKGVIEWK